MLKRFLTLAAPLGVAAGLAFAEAPKPAAAPEPRDILRLVQQLGSDQYAERETATQRLDALGADAIDYLRRAASGRDPEIRRRATEVLARVERRVQSTKLLQARKIRLVYNEVPVAEAVEDLGRRTGFTLQIEGDRTQVDKRKVTLDTGEVTFWEAMDQFCQKASLTEKESPAVQDNGANNPWDMNRRMVWWGGGRTRYDPEHGNQHPIILKDGKPKTVPTCYAGAVRIRILPTTAAAAGVPKADQAVGDASFAIEVSPEPKLGWQGLQGLRLTKIEDAAGKPLTPPLPYVHEADTQMEEMMIWDGRGYSPQITPGTPQHVPLHLSRGKGNAKALRLVQGTVAAELITSALTVITIKDILKAQGETIKGSDGGSIKVLEAKREDDGHIRLNLTVESAMPQSGNPWFGAVRVWNGGTPSGGPDEVARVGREMSLADARGNLFSLKEANIRDLENGNGTKEYTLVFAAPNGSALPDKLVYKGQQKLIVEVPFTLKDVDLP